MADERLEQWFEMAQDLLCTANKDGYFTSLSSSWERVLGWTREELMSRRYIEFVHPDDVAPTTQVARSLVVPGAETVSFQNRFRTRDGDWLWLHWSARSDGETIYASARDVTERRQWESDREQLVTRLETLARTDELTGLPNRRYWDEELARELARARREHARPTVGLLDLDRFKAVNDAQGHQAGDDLLREAAFAWRLALRVSDFIARYGGEEFAILLPATPLPEALVALERVREATPHGQTCSIGVAQWNGEETGEALVARADAMLYEAKAAGRDSLAADPTTLSSRFAERVFREKQP